MATDTKAAGTASDAGGPAYEKLGWLATGGGLGFAVAAVLFPVVWVARRRRRASS